MKNLWGWCSKIMIIEIVLVALSIIILNKWCFKQANKEKETFEKVLYIIFIIITDIFLVIYYIDRFNLPSILKISDNINTQNWLIVITSCISSIISASIGGLIAFFVANKEIDVNNKQNEENNRIQNMPLMSYEFYSKKSNNKLIELNTNIENGTMGEIDFTIKNIGLNAARNVKINIESNIINESIENSYYILEKDKTEFLSFVGYFTINEEYHFKVKIFYQDLLLNTYEQEIEFTYELTPYTNGSERNYIIGNLLIKEEKLIKK